MKDYVNLLFGKPDPSTTEWLKMTAKFISEGARMDEARKVHNVEQTMTMWREIMEQAPPMLYRFYKDLNKQGFPENHSLALTAEALKKMLYPAG